MRYKVVGPPGTGKTRRLLNEVQRYVDKGVSLKKIGYFAFTRKAAGEARDRFLKVKTELTKKDIILLELQDLKLKTFQVNFLNVIYQIQMRSNY